MVRRWAYERLTREATTRLEAQNCGHNMLRCAQNRGITEECRYESKCCNVKNLGITLVEGFARREYFHLTLPSRSGAHFYHPHLNCTIACFGAEFTVLMGQLKDSASKQSLFCLGPLGSPSGTMHAHGTHHAGNLNGSPNTKGTVRPVRSLKSCLASKTVVMSAYFATLFLCLALLVVCFLSLKDTYEIAHCFLFNMIHDCCLTQR